ncbi:diguanylate cyclase [Aquipseudomonas ullengensis]|uniref:diguanylate cyclase n=1 Tax=Aquipseudomonas ullengensis TaxID=2759166 RepID=A0A7W4Q9S4_9GAMM|nr:diguanylate cyclase [Pseudomonas ullengensis]MBB2495092.1 diguanylate cyclase [Pseudomonas ullengensis]
MRASKRLKTGFVLVIVLLSVNLLAPFFTTREVALLLGEYEEQERLHSNLQQLLSALKDGETGQRGFIITGREDFLTPLYQGYGEVDKTLKVLKQDLRHDAALSAVLQRLEPRIDEQRTYFSTVIQLRRDQGLQAASDLISQGHGKQLMDHVRSLAGEVLVVLEQRMLVLEQKLRAHERLRMVLLVSMTVVDLIMIGLLFYFTFQALHEGRQVQRNLQGLSDQLSSGMQRVELRNREISLLNRLGRAMHLSNQFDECYQIIDCFAAQLFPLNSGCLYLYHPSRDVLERVLGWGGNQEEHEMFEPQACWAIRRGQSHEVKDASKDLLCPHLHGSAQAPQGYLCVPLMAQGEPLGVLTLLGQPMVDQDLAETFAEQVALGISNLSLRDSLRQQSLVDALTGLHNRRFLDETLRRELLRASRKQLPVAVVLLDVDHFKRFNDTFGHEAGDLVLRHLAIEMKRNVRTSDLACRYGGEEFALVLPEISREDAIERCETLRLSVTRLQIRYGGQPLGPVSISLGLAWFPADGEQADVLLHAADTALYQAKHAGRNRLCIYRSEAGDATLASS